MTTFASPISMLVGRRSARTAFLIGCAAVLAAGPASPAHAAPTPPATAAPAATSFDALDVATLRAHLNEKIEVRGTPTGTGQNKPGNIGYLNFAAAHKAVALVFFLKPSEPGKAGSVDDIKPFVGKPVVATGTLTDYKGDLQIVVETLDQIKAAP